LCLLAGKSLVWFGIFMLMGMCWVGEGAAGAAPAADSGLQGSQAQYVRVPLADGTLVKVGGCSWPLVFACWQVFTLVWQFYARGSVLLWLGWWRQRMQHQPLNQG
jgi:hypothetical protein